MPIPNSQLETWSHQGSITQSSTTYQTIRTALLDSEAAYSSKSYNVFLQGSYGNDTNIYSESDVDTVIRLDSIFHGDVSGLSNEDLQAYRNSRAADSTMSPIRSMYSRAIWLSLLGERKRA